MPCCPQFERLMDRVSGEERHQSVGLNYCPFRGRVLSRKLWNLEKKK